jgi:hypothetical protein
VKWLALIDLDEFIIPVEHSSLVELLKEYEEFSGLGINWQCYGTSNVAEVEPGQLLTEQLLWKAESHEPRNLTVKCIVRPDRVDRFINPHWALYKKGYNVGSDKERFIEHCTREVLVDKVRLNHYFQGDMKYFQEVKLPRYAKRPRRDPNSLEKENIPAAFDPQWNAVCDPIMERFTPQLREAIQ